METEQNETGKEKDVVDAVVVPEVHKQKDKLDDLFALMRESTGYMVNITILRNGRLNHHVLLSDFPDMDMLKSIKEYEKLAVERLKNI
jgi:hypothetical protein